jgi:hypothetical protein
MDPDGPGLNSDEVYSLVGTQTSFTINPGTGKKWISSQSLKPCLHRHHLSRSGSRFNPDEPV